MSAARLLDVSGLSIYAEIGGERRTIVKDLDFRLDEGETIGIVGESGSGKSMTARALTGLLPRNVTADGTMLYRERQVGLRDTVSKLRGTEITLLLQNPFTMLNPLHRCGVHIEEGLNEEKGKKLGKAERRAEAVRRLAEVGIHEPNVAERYPFQLSGGMQQRVGLAAALARDPHLLIADEPTTALDVTTQMDVMALLKSVQEHRRMGLILITHDLRLAFAVCDRLYVLYAGTMLETGRAGEIEAQPMHPYSRGLLLSEPSVEHRRETLQAIPGSVPVFDEVADRCAFADRCEWKADECTGGRPPLVPLSPTRSSACVRIDAIRAQLAVRPEQAVALASAAAALPTKAETPLIELRELRKTFPGDVQALKGVSVYVERGESVGIVGESGSGKTTLARCLLGLETPTSGGLTIAGIDASDFAKVSKAERRQLRRTIQIVFQDPFSSLNPARTVGSTLSEACSMRGKVGPGVADLLGLVGLPAAYAKRKPAALSGGERQRVAVARAIAVEPEILVCDEPVSALDVSVQAQILNLLGELRQQLGLTYVFISHDLAVVRQVVDRAYVFYRGEIVEEGQVEQILQQPKHPYTARLLEAQSRLTARDEHSDPDLVEATN